MGETNVKRHPGDGFILGNRGPLDELQSQSLIVKGESEDGTWRRPGADHEMVNRHCGG